MIKGIFECIEVASDLVIDNPDVLGTEFVIEWRGHDILISVSLDKDTSAVDKETHTFYPA